MRPENIFTPDLDNDEHKCKLHLLGASRKGGRRGVQSINFPVDGLGFVASGKVYGET
jgi:hypothetical protein